MFMIPSGPEDVTLRRVPYVTFGILLLHLVGYLCYVFVLPVPDTKPLQTALDYRYNRPYVVAAPELEDLLRFTEPRSRPRQKPKNPDVLDAEQAKMDAFSMEALKVLPMMPHRRYAMLSTHPTLLSFLFHSWIHISLIGLLMLGFFIYICAPYLEDRWGRPFFAIFYGCSGLFAGFWTQITYSSTPVVIYGSGGAVGAILAAYFVFYWRHRLRFSLPLNLHSGEAYGPSLSLLPIFVVAMLLLAFMLGSQFGFGFPPALHIIYGAVFGGLVGLALKFFKLEKNLYQSPFEQLPREQQLEILIPERMKMNRLEEAREFAREGVRLYPENVEFLNTFWSLSINLDNLDGAKPAGLRLFSQALEEMDWDRAYFLWQQLFSKFGVSPSCDVIESFLHGLLDVGHALDARQVVLDVLAGVPRAWREEQVLSFLETVRFVDPKLSIRAIDQFMEIDDLKPCWNHLRGMRQEILSFYPDAEEEAERRSIELSAHGLGPGEGAIDMENPFAPTAVKVLRVHPSMPLQLGEHGLHIRIDGQTEVRLLRFDHVKTIAAASIREIGGRPYLLLDLFTDDPFSEREGHAVLRFESNRFDPRKIIANEKHAGTAIRKLTQAFLNAGAMGLPDESGLREGRYARFASIEDCELHLYGVSSNGRGVSR